MRVCTCVWMRICMSVSTHCQTQPRRGHQQKAVHMVPATTQVGVFQLSPWRPQFHPYDRGGAMSVLVRRQCHRDFSDAIDGNLVRRRRLAHGRLVRRLVYAIRLGFAGIGVGRYPFHAVPAVGRVDLCFAGGVETLQRAGRKGPLDQIAVRARLGLLWCRGGLRGRIGGDSLAEEQ